MKGQVLQPAVGDAVYGEYRILKPLFHIDPGVHKAVSGPVGGIGDPDEGEEAQGGRQIHRRQKQADHQQDGVTSVGQAPLDPAAAQEKGPQSPQKKAQTQKEKTHHPKHEKGGSHGGFPPKKKKTSLHNY